MVEIIQSDIFEAPVEIIIHQANCFCTMGSGIAKEIKRRYPRAYDSDCMTKSGDPYKLGQFTFAAPGEDQDKWIINLYGQFRYGKGEPGVRYTDYEALEKGFKAIKSWLEKMGLEKTNIGIPYKIGSDRGGGDWNVVESLIREVFEQSDMQVFICQR